MEKKNFLKHFSQALLINSLICAIIVLTAYRFDYPSITLGLPIVFLILTSTQQTITTPQHAVFIILLLSLIPLTAFVSPGERTLIFALFYLSTITSFDMALRRHHPLPFPDPIPFVFMLVSRIVMINPKIIFGLVVAYYFAKLTTLYLTALTLSNNSNRGDK